MSDSIRDVAREMREGAESVLETAVNEHVRMSAHAVLSWATRLEQAIATQQSATVPDERARFDDWWFETNIAIEDEQDLNEVRRLAWSAWQAALNASPAAPSGWQPIESAPKDGRAILIYYKNELGKGRRVKAAWREDGFDDDTGDEQPEGWYEQIDNYDDCTDCYISREPTHWMPLPAPPAHPNMKEEG